MLLAAAIVVGALIGPSAALAGTSTWTGAADGFWTLAGNWDPGLPGAADSVRYDGTSTTNLAGTLDGVFSLDALTVASPGGPVSITRGDGGRLVISGGISVDGQNLTLPDLCIGADQSWTVDPGHTLAVGAISNAGYTVTFTGGGTLRLDRDGVLDSTAGGLTLSGGTLSLANTYLGRGLGVGADSTIDVARNFAATLGGPFTGTGTLTLRGGYASATSSMLSLLGSGGNTFSGNIVLSAGGGTLRIGGTFGAAFTPMQGITLPSMTSADTITVNRGATFSIDDNLTASAGGYVGDRLGSPGNRPAVNLVGGALTYNGASTTLMMTQTVGTVTLVAGASTITAYRNNGTNSLIAASLVPAKGAFVTFAGNGAALGTGTNDGRIIFTTPPANVVGGGGLPGTKTMSIVTGARVGTDFAYYGAKGIRALFAGEYQNLVGNDISVAGATENVRFTNAAPSAFVPLAVSQTINSLSITSAVNATWSLGGNTLTLTSGQLLSTASNTRNITNGVITAGAGADTDLDVTVLLSGTTMIGATIADNGAGAVTLVKNGPGALTLSNATDNTYSGGTFVNEGTLSTLVVTNRRFLGSGAVRIDNAVFNLNAGGATAFAGPNQAAYTATNGALVNIANGAYTNDSDTFNIGAGSIIAGTTTVSTNSGINSLTRVDSLAGISGGQVVLDPGAIVAFGGTPTANLGVSPNTLKAGAGTNADLYFGLAANSAANSTITVGSGTPWRGISTDRTARNFLSGTITANSDFDLQGFGAPSIAPVLLTMASTGPVAINTPNDNVTVNVLGTVTWTTAATALGSDGHDVNFVVNPGATFTLIPQLALGASPGSSASLTVRAGGILALSSMPNALAGATTIEGGGKLNASLPGGLTGPGQLTFRPGSVIDVANATGFSGSQAAGATIAPGTIVRLSVANFGDTVFPLDTYLQAASPVYEVFNGNNWAVNPAVANTTIMTLNRSADGVGGMLVNDAATRAITAVPHGVILVGTNGGTIAATAGTTLTVQSPIVMGTNELTIGSAESFDGTLPKLGIVSLTASNTHSTALPGSRIVIVPGATLNHGVDSIPDAADIVVNGIFTNGAVETLGSVAGTGRLETAASGLTVGRNDNSTTFSGVLTGAGAFTKSGSGRLDLTGGASPYSGQVTVDGGILALSGAGQLTNTGATAFSLVGDGVLLLDNSATDNTNRLSGMNPGITFQGGTFRFQGKDGVGSRELLGTATFAAGASTIDVINGTGAGSSSVLIFSNATAGAGTVNFTASNGTLGTAGDNPRVLFTNTAAGVIGYATVGNAPAYYNTVTGVRAFTIGEGTEFNGAAVQTGLNTVFTLANTTPTLTGPRTVNSLWIDSPGTGKFVNMATNNLLIASGRVSLTGTDSFEIRRTGTGAVTNSAANGRLYFGIADAGTTLTISAPIASGTGTVEKDGAGTLVLNAASTFTTGGLVVNDGTVLYGAAGDLAGNTTPVTIWGDGVFDLSGKSDSVGAVTVKSGTITNSVGGGSYTVASLSLGGGPAGSAASANSGSGSLKLGGNVTFDALNNPNMATIAGALDLNGATRTFTIGNSVVAGAVVDVDLRAAITGAAGFGITKAGAGVLRLGGANTFDGPLTMAASVGTIVLGHAQALGTPSVARLVSIGSGSTLALDGVGVSDPAGLLTLRLMGSGDPLLGPVSGALVNLAGDNTVPSAIALGAASQIASLSAGEKLTLSGTISALNSNLTVIGEGNLELSGSLALGTGTLTKNGGGLLTLSGAAANVYTGLTTVSGGYIILNKSGSAQAIPGALTINNGGSVLYASASPNPDMLGVSNVTINGTGQLDFNGASDTIGNVTIVANGATSGSTPIQNTAGGGSLTLGTLGITPVAGYDCEINPRTGTLNLGGTVTFTAATTGRARISGRLGLGAATRTFAIGGGSGVGYDMGIFGDISGDAGAGLTLSGAGRLQLSGTNVYSGDTTIGAGTQLRCGDSGAIPNGAGKGNVVLTGILDANGYDPTINGLSGAGTVLSSNGASVVTVGAGDAGGGFSGTIKDGSGVVSYTKIGSGTQTNSGIISCSGQVTVNDGILVLSAANTYTSNTVVNGGTLRMGISTAIPSGTGRGGLVLGGTLDLNATGAVVNSLSGTGTVDNLTGIGNYTLTVSNNQACAFDGILTDSSGTQAVVKTGTGTFTLTGTNTHFGVTTVSMGSLNIRNPFALGATNGNTTVASGATLELQGGLVTTNEPLTLNGPGLAGAGALRNVADDNTFAGLLTLAGNSRINSDSGTLTLSHPGTVFGAGFSLTVGGAGNVVLNSIIGTTSGGLTMDGTGVLTLTGASTNSGATVVSNGTLLVNGSLAAGSVVTNLAGATLGGIGLIRGGVTNAGTLSPGDPAINNGVGTNTLGRLNVLAGSTVIVEVADAGAYDQVLVTNNNGLVISDVAASVHVLVYQAGTTNAWADNGSFNLFSYSNTAPATAGMVWDNAGGKQYRFEASSGFVKLVLSSEKTWNGAADPDGNWSTALNWSDNTAPAGGESLQFGGTANLATTNDLAANTAFAGFTFLPGSGAFTLAGNELNLEADVTNNSSQLQTFSLPLVLAGNHRTLSAAAGDLLVSGAISQSGGQCGVIKAGTNTLTLSASNTFGGAVTVGAGAVNVQNAAALGATNGGTVVTNGAALQLQGGLVIAGEPLALYGTGVAGDGALRSLSGTNTYAGPITLGGAALIEAEAGLLTLDVAAGNAITSAAQSVTFGGAGSIVVADAIALTGGQVIKTDGGTLTLAAFNTFTGGVQLTGGTLVINSNQALGTTAGALTIAAGTTLDATVPGVITLANPQAWNGDFTFAGSQNLTLGAGAVALGGDRIVTVISSNLQVNGVIGPAGSAFGLTKAGAGTLVLGGANTYSGVTTVDAGTLRYGVANAISNGPVVINGGTLDVVSFSDTVGTVVLTNGAILGTSGVLISTGGFVFESGFVGAILSGPLGVTKNSGGTVTLGGANTFTGTNVIHAGTLVIGNATALGPTASARLLFGPGSTGRLQLNGTNTTVIGLNTDATPGAPVVENGSGLAATLTVNTATGTDTFAGLLQDGAAGALALTKGAAGTLVLANTNNSYGGATTVSAGTLRLGASGVIPNGTGKGFVSVTGLLDLGGFDETVNGLTGGGTVTNTTGAGTLVVGDGDAGGGFSGTLRDGTGALAYTKIGAGTQTNSGVISCSGRLTIEAGTLVLSAANTYTNNTEVNGGTLRMGNAAAIPSGAGKGNVTLAGTLDLNAYSATVNGLSGAGTVDNLNGTATYTLSVGNNNQTSVFGGAIRNATGTNALTKAGSGTLTLTGSNSYAGVTTVSAGTLNIRNASALGATNGATTVASGAALELQGGFVSAVEALTLNGTGITNAGALRNVADDNTYAGLITLSGASRITADSGTLTLSHTGTVLGAGYSLTVGGAGNVTINSALGTTSGALTKDGAGILTLGGANTNTGPTTINEGTVVVAHPYALRTSMVSNLVASAGLTFSGGQVFSLGGLAGTGDVGLTNAAGAPVTLVISNNASAIATYSGVLGGPGSLTKLGTGTQILANASTVQYTGNTTVSNGVLSLAAACLDAGADVFLYAGAKLNLNFVGTNAIRSLYLDNVRQPVGTYGANNLGSRLTGTGFLRVGFSPLVYWTGGIDTNWATSVTNWTRDPSVLTEYPSNVPSIGDDVVFNVNTTTVTALIGVLGGNQAANSLSFANLSSELSIRDDGSTLTLGGGTVSVAAGKVASLYCDIAGDNGLTRSGMGLLSLYGANSYSGTTVNAGAVLFGSAGAVGGAVANVTLANTSTVVAVGYPIDQAFLNRINEASTGTVALAASSGENLAFSAPGLNTVYLGALIGGTYTNSGSLTAAGGLYRLGGGGGTLVLDGANALSGAADVLVWGGTAASRVVLAGANSFSGNVTVTNLPSTVVLQVRDSAAFGTSTSIVVASNSRLELDGGVAIDSGKVLTLSGTGGNNTGALSCVTGSNVWAGPVIMKGTTTLGVANPGAVLDVRGDINGAGYGLDIRAASATVILGGAATYSGLTTLHNGTLLLAGDDRLPATGTLNLGATASGVNVFDLNGHNQQLGGISNTLATAATRNVTNSAANLSTLTISNLAGSAHVYSGTLDGNLRLVKNGDGVQVLWGTNTYTGVTAINGGALRLGNSLAAQNTTVSNLVDAGLTFTNGTTFTLGGLAGIGNIPLRILGGPAITLSVGNNNEDTLYGGQLVSLGGLEKVGTGTLVLANANAYAGATTISAGTLQLGDGGTAGEVAGSVTIAEGAVLALRRSDAMTVMNAIDGAGTLVQKGSGAVILAVDSEHAGGTIISSGVLQLGENGTAGWVNGDVVNDGALVFNRSVSGAFSGWISGPGGVVQTGDGTVTLSNDNTYGGQTIVSNGVLALANVNAVRNSTVRNLVAGGLAFSGGQAFTLGGLAGSGDIGLVNDLSEAVALTVGNNDTDTTYGGGLSGSGGLVKVGSGKLTLTGLCAYAGNTTVAGGTLSLSQPCLAVGSDVFLSLADSVLELNFAGTNTLRNLVVEGLSLPDGVYGAANLPGHLTGTGSVKIQGSGVSLVYWDGQVSDSWADAGNWTTDPAVHTPPASAPTSADDVIVGVTNYAVPHALARLGGNQGAKSLTFRTACAITGGVDTLTLGGFGTVYASTNVTLNCAIDGVSGLTKLGGGILTLGGANRYAGATKVSAGTLKSGASNVIPDGAGKGDVTIDATLDLAGYDEAVNGLAGVGTVCASGGASVLTVGSNDVSSTFSGVLADNGGSLAIDKVGAGAFVLDGTNTYTGTTTIRGGQVILTCAVAATNSTFELQADDGLAFYRTTTATLGGLAGVGSLGLTNLDGAAVTVSIGNNDADTTYAGTLIGAAVPVKIGTGTLSLSGTNFYDGVIHVAAGRLSVMDEGVLHNTTVDNDATGGLGFAAGVTAATLGGLAGSGDFGLTNTEGAAVTLAIGNNGDRTVYSGAMGGSGSLVKVGPGDLTLTGLNPFSGETTVNDGRLVLGAARALQNSIVTLNATNGLGFDSITAATLVGVQGSGLLLITNFQKHAVTLTISNTVDVTFAGTIGGEGNLIKTGPGTLTLSGAGESVYGAFYYDWAWRSFDYPAAKAAGRTTWPTSRFYYPPRGADGTYHFTNGVTRIDQGVLVADNNYALRYNTVRVNVPNGLQFSTNVTELEIGGLAGTGDIVLTNAAGLPVGLAFVRDMGDDYQTNEYSGVLSGPGYLTSGSAYIGGLYDIPGDNNVGAGAVRAGGTVWFTGSNTYSGETGVFGNWHFIFDKPCLRGTLRVDSAGTSVGQSLFYLMFDATNDIEQLYIANIPKANNVYGSGVGSGGFAGPGYVRVTNATYSAWDGYVSTNWADAGNWSADTGSRIEAPAPNGLRDALLTVSYPRSNDIGTLGGDQAANLLMFMTNAVIPFDGPNALTIAGGVIRGAPQKTGTIGCVLAGTNVNVYVTDTTYWHLHLTATNRLEGVTYISRGYVYLDSDGALGSSTLQTPVGSTPRVVLGDGVNITNAFSFNGGNVTPCLWVPAGTGTWSGPINIGGNLSQGRHFGATNDAQLTLGPVSGGIEGNPADSITFNNAAGCGGTVLFSAPCDFLGDITLSYGCIKAGVDNALPATMTLTFKTNALAPFLDLNGHTQTLNGVVTYGLGLGNGCVVTNTSATPATLRIGGPATNTYRGRIVDGAGSTALEVAGGAFTLARSNSYSGVTTVSGGRLTLGTNYAVAANSPVTITGGTLDLGNKIQATDVAVSFQGGVVSNGTYVKTGEDYDAQGGTVSAILAGSVGLAKSGPGTFVVSGTNTYTGVTSITGGRLRTDNGISLQNTTVSNAVSGGLAFGPGLTTAMLGGLMGDGAIAMTNVAGAGVTLQVGASGGDTSYGGVLTGVGPLEKVGAGALTLTNTCHANMTVSSGTLVLSDTVCIDSNITVAVTTNGVLDLAYAGTGYVTSLVLDGVPKLPGVYRSSNAGPFLAGSGAVRVLGAVGMYWDGTDSGDWAAPNNWTTDPSGKASPASPPAATDDVVFNAPYASAHAIATLSGNRAARSLTFNASAASYAISDPGYRLTNITGIITVDRPVVLDCLLAGTNGLTLVAEGAGSTLTLGQPGVYAGHTVVSNGTLVLGVANAIPDGAGAGNLSVAVGAGLDLAGHDETVNGLSGAGTIDNSSGSPCALTVGGANAGGTFSGSIANSGAAVALAKTGSGTVVLSGTNAYVGTTTINAGKLSLVGQPAVAPASTFVLGVANGLLFNGATAFALGGLAGSGDLVLQDENFTALALTVGGNGSNTVYSGVLSKSLASLLKVGAGTLALSGTSTYSGGTVISNGVLQLGIGGTTGWVPDANLTNHGALAFNRSDAVTFAGRISGSGRVVLAGSGQVTLTASNTYSGGTIISNGILRLGTGGTVGSIAGSVTNAGTLAFNHSDTVTFPGQISGPGSVAHQGTGLLVLPGSNTYAGVTTISAGPLMLANTNAAQNSLVSNAVPGGVLFSNLTSATIGGLHGSGDIGLTNTAGGAVALRVGGDGNTVFSGVLGGSGSLVKLGSGSLRLEGANTYLGTTTVSNGTLSLSSAFLPSNDVFLATGVTLDLDFDGTNTIRSLYVGPSQADPGVYSAANPPAGVTITGNGALRITVGAALPVADGSWVAGDGRWSDAANWQSFVIGGGVDRTATFTNLPGLAKTVTNTYGVLNVGRLVFSNSLAGIGWTVTGGVLNLTNTTATVPAIGVSNGTVVIASALTGVKGLAKLGAGTLVLTGTNAYGGGTAISNGVLQLGDGGTSGFISGAVTNAGVLTFNRGDSNTFAGVISGAGSVVLAGAGQVTLTANNTYAGGTQVRAGTLAVNNGAGSGTGSGGVIVSNGATLTGSGTIAGTLSLTGTVSPGVGVGVLTTGSNAWHGGGSYLWELSDASTNSGYDQLLVSGAGAINVQATTGTPFTINVVTPESGAANLDSNGAASTSVWTIATAGSGGVLNFATNKFTLDTSRFMNTPAGRFALATSGAEVQIIYVTPSVPRGTVFKWR